MPAIQEALTPFFRNLGLRVSSSPQLVLLMCITTVALCTLGLLSLNVETDPLQLWMPPASRAAQDKAMYDKTFGPFYRIEQLIISTKLGPDGKQPPVLTHDNIEMVSISL
jgi:Niemann-Pick C1 protein